MDKVDRINSIDSHSAEAKADFKKGFIEFQKDFPEIELIISVETSDKSLLSILVLPDQEAFDLAHDLLPLCESELSLYATFMPWQPRATIAVCRARRT